MEAVGNLDEDNAYVVAHREQELLESFGLQRGAVAEDAARYFRDALHDVGDFRTEEVAEVFVRVVSVFLHVVQECGADRGRPEPYFSAGDLRHGDGVQDIRLAGAAAHAFVRLLGKVESLGDEFHLAAVVSSEVRVEQMLESRLYHLLV